MLEADTRGGSARSVDKVELSAAEGVRSLEVDREVVGACGFLTESCSMVFQSSEGLEGREDGSKAGEAEVLLAELGLEVKLVGVGVGDARGSG
jgi:hypothetical protein